MVPRVKTVAFIVNTYLLNQLVKKINSAKYLNHDLTMVGAGLLKLASFKKLINGGRQVIVQTFCKCKVKNR